MPNPGRYRGTATGGGGFNPYGAGIKRYGGAGRSMPTMGPVDPLGYKERDAQLKARRNAMLRRLQSSLKGSYASANYNRTVY